MPHPELDTAVAPLRRFLSTGHQPPDDTPFTMGSGLAKRQVTFGEARALLAATEAAVKPPEGHRLEGLLEPGSRDDNLELGFSLGLSQAISMKRIADLIAGDDRRLNLVDAISEAIVNGLRLR